MECKIRLFFLLIKIRNTGFCNFCSGTEIDYISLPAKNTTITDILTNYETR